MAARAPADDKPTWEGACPLCGRGMIAENDRLVCETKPDCKGWRRRPLHRLLEELRAARLPGF